jgi:hypothetical protein
MAGSARDRSDSSRDSHRGEPSAEDHGTADVNVLAKDFADVGPVAAGQHDTGDMLDGS